MQKLLVVIFALIINLAYADEQLAAQYVLNAMNANNQTQLIVEKINDLSNTRVSINYYGNSIYIANEVKAAINQSYNGVTIEMNSLNSYMSYSTAQVIVSLYSNQQPAKQQSNQSTGNFFNYDSEPKGFFNYGDQ